MITSAHACKIRLYKVLLCAFTAMLLFACKQQGKRPANVVHQITNAKDTPAMYANKKPVSDTINTEDCPRGIPEPVIKKDVFPSALFVLAPDHKTSVETLVLTDGEKLTIKQSGCEYYILSFRFETSRFEADTADINYWGNVVLSLMKKVNKGLDTPLEIDKALTNLSARVDYNGNIQPDEKIKLGDEIDFGGPDPRQYLTIERVTQLAEKRYAIELSLSYGPI